MNGRGMLAVVMMVVGMAAAARAEVGAGPVWLPSVMERLYENRVEVESGEWLSVNWFFVGGGGTVDPAKAKDAARFVVFSPDDEAYGAKGLAAAASGSRTRTVKVPQRNDQWIQATVLFVKLPRGMVTGKHYGVRVEDVGMAVRELGTVLYDDRRQVNDNVRVNQLGYLPGMGKHAYVGQYLGDLGGMEVGAKEFELLDEGGRSVFKGAVVRRGVGDELVGQVVYDLDFTAFETVGTYRVCVPGVGVSYPFDIGPRALAPLYVNLMRGNYQERCGMAIEAPFVRHAREACHLDDAYWDAEAEKLKFVVPKNPPLYPTKYDGQRHAAIHGHHDAGDYGKYTTTGADYVFSILNAMEVFPDKFREDNSGLPYSGNGVPDLVEEVKWELDWLENMQDPDDGGVFGVIRPRTGGYEQYMPPKEGKRFFFPKDTTFTGSYVGTLAHAARSPVMQKYYPEECKRYLARAIKSWEFLEKNPRYVEWTFYGANFGDWDERCWAAVELYGATGDKKYHDYFLKEFDPGKKRWGWWGLFDAAGYATEAYTFMGDRPRDAAMLKRCEEAIKQACEKHVVDGAANAYRLSLPDETVKHGAYGWVFPGDMAGYDLLMGYALVKDKRYLECALGNQDYTCGANPSGYFLQTGLGAKRNSEVVSETSNHDGIVEPVGGLPLGIGSDGFYWLSQYGKKLGEGEYPKNWPLLNRWYDGFNVTTEFTMGPLARETIVAAFFAGEGKGAAAKAGRPVVKIKADRVTGPAPLKVHFSYEPAAGTRRIREVFWDLDDETFSTLAAPTHVFGVAGKHYRVAVTVVDEDGVSAFDEIDVDGALGEVKFSRQPGKADAGTMCLYHFDGDLKEAGGKAAEPKVVTGRAMERKAWRFAQRSPMWMKEPRGSCLELDGAEQFAVQLPGDFDAGKAGWEVEMKVYLQAFDGWAYPGDPILLGVGQGDTWVGLRQETWERSGLPKFGAASGEGGVKAGQFKEFPRERWCEVKLTYDGKGTACLLVDGTSWGEIRGIAWRGASQGAKLTFGALRGSVDEVRMEVTGR